MVEDLHPNPPAAGDEDLVRRRLREAVADVHADERNLPRPSTPRHDRRLLVAAAAVLVAVALAAGLLLASRRADRGPIRVQTPQPTVSSAPPSTTLPDPWAPSPVDLSWTETSPAPLTPTQPNVVWTGREVILWGEGGGTWPGADNNRGVAYTPATDSWREIAPSPIPSNALGAVWTGTEMVVTAAPTGATEEAVLGYDPATDRWRTITERPSRAAAPTAWVDGAVLFAGGMYSNWMLTLLDPTTGLETALPIPPGTPTNQDRPNGGISITVADDGTMYARNTTQSSLGVWSRFARGDTTWQRLPDEPAGASHDDPPLWVDGEVVVTGLLPVAFDPTTDAWHRPSAPPAASAAPDHRPSGLERVTDRSLVVGDRIWTKGRILDVATGTWSRLPEVPTQRADDIVAAATVAIDDGLFTLDADGTGLLLAPR
jgi:hypothetical protein